MGIEDFGYSPYILASIGRELANEGGEKMWKSGLVTWKWERRKRGLLTDQNGEFKHVVLFLPPFTYSQFQAFGEE